ncbi:hypothetical protein J2X04_001079 [Lysobacter niabensis]|uniref:Uncharacterized protein n=1 Tax=Agrilutibacter niabensis TaxID=380628 RepID=A0ABU1VMN4_9GAMM|nr:hypothetical protein [Lysobacter niabensis]
MEGSGNDWIPACAGMTKPNDVAVPRIARQNSALPGARGYGIASRMLLRPQT